MLSNVRLFIAEKPSLGRAIAAVLPKPHQKKGGYIEASNGDIVSWCIGHLLEAAPPEAYKAEWKKWSLDHLPILPNPWQLQAKAGTQKQLSVLKQLIKRATTIVHAGDPDREGQLLVDEVLHHLNVKPQQLQNVQRCLISDLTPAAIRRALKQMQSNLEFRNLSTSALARSRADWIYGINLTRAYTLQGQSSGYQGVLSVGRVQTPVLGLVVHRDVAIDTFVSHAYFDVWAKLCINRRSIDQHNTDKHSLAEYQQTFSAKWLPSDACKPYLDDQGRNLSRPLAEHVVKKISHTKAEVQNIEREHKQLPAPLPFDLSSLQIAANRQYGLSAQQTLDACQALYEQYQLITYPRSDCRYLPKQQQQDIPTVIDAIHQHIREWPLTPLNQCHLAQLHHEPPVFHPNNKAGRAWNDTKVGAHHAIIPTGKVANQANLSNTEKNIYQLVARQYLAQFYDRWQYADTKVTVMIDGGQFIAKAREVMAWGWKQLFQSSSKSSSPPKIDQETNNDNQTILPPLTIGQQLQSLEGEVREGKTKPPAHYTDASLLAAMTGIAKHVKDDNLKKILRETDGLGTEATRAGIIERLIERGFLVREKKNIEATQAGKAFISALPEDIALPDRTARWEALLADISQGQARYDDLMQPLAQEIHQMLQTARQFNGAALQGLGKPPTKTGKRFSASSKRPYTSNKRRAKPTSKNAKSARSPRKRNRN